MAGSKSTQDVARAVFLGRILKAWEKVPDQAFGAFLVHALTHASLQDMVSLAYLPDNSLAELLERYVLLGERHNRP
jgi:hypothetical protein